MTTLLDELRFGAVSAVNNAVTRALAITGDPIAMLDSYRPGSDDPYEIAERIRMAGPLVESRLGVLATASHHVCRAVLRSPIASSKQQQPSTGLERLLDSRSFLNPLDGSFIAMDGLDHSRLRRLVSVAFTPKALNRHRAQIERTAHELLDAVDHEATVDLIQAFAAPLPMGVICNMLGLPSSEHARFFAWGETLISALDRVRTVAVARSMHLATAELSAYLSAVVTERRRHPGDDLVSDLVEAADQGDRLSDDEIVSTITLLLIAGFETTVNLIGTGTKNLLAHEEQRALLLEDPSTHLGGLVEESLRYEGPVQFTFRQTMGEISVLGDDAEGGPLVVIPSGRLVILSLAGAGRDPSVFTSPNDFDITRPNAREHLAFATGAHYCLGAGLARMEAEIAWRVLFERYPKLRKDGVATYRPTPIMRGLSALPVRLR